MRASGVRWAAVALLILGVTAQAAAAGHQDSHGDRDGKEQHQGRGNGKGHSQKHAREHRPRVTIWRQQPRQGVTYSRRQPAIVRISQQSGMWPRYRAHSWSSEHHTWLQRGGYSGYRIPDNRYNLCFSRSHRFHVAEMPMRIVGGYPQFHTQGYWFALMDPVPEYWTNNWYEENYVNVIERDDGYYLMNPAYPNNLLAISVYLR